MHIVSDFTKYRMSFLNAEAFSYIPDLRKLDDVKNDITEDEFHQLLKLTKDEIKQIAEFE